MLRRDLLSEFNIDKEQIEREVALALSDMSAEQLEADLDESVRDFSVNTVLEGRVVGVTNDEVLIDVGYKSEGAIPRHEWNEPSLIEVGQSVEVLLEAVEDEVGVVQLSKRKADRLRAWERIVAQCKEGDIVTGRVLRKIKGGLLVDIGVPVFLPASQVDIRRPAEIADFIGRSLTCTILKIDEERRNIVVSRRQLIETQRAMMQERLFPRLVKGEIRTGKVKNIVDFGAFVDLGGIDGLLHITDMSWGRTSHPSEMVAIDDDIEVKILNVDQDKGKVALGLKQKTPSPWANVADKFPPGTVVRGEAVNLMSYGAFVKLEEGIEGLVHISEMSWTRRINHPSEVVAIGDVVDVVVLGIDHDKEQISLGMKQTEPDPWQAVALNYPSGTKVVGRVRNLTSYGAFIEIEEGIDGLLHVSDISWTRKVNHPSEILKKGDTVETVVLEVDVEKRRLALGLKQLESDPWDADIPNRYRPGDMARGVVSKLTSFGAFVELEEGLEGLLHISELSDKKIASPEEILAVGDVVDIRVIRIDSDSRKIGLSLRSDQGSGARDQEAGTVPPEAPGGAPSAGWAGPRLVMRNDQIAAAENPQEIIQQALQAPVGSALQAPVGPAPTEATEGAGESPAPEPALDGQEPDEPLQAGLGDSDADASALQAPVGSAPTDATEAPEPEGPSGEPAEETPQADAPSSDEEDGQEPDEQLQAPVGPAPTDATEAAEGAGESPDPEPPLDGQEAD
jgi:small subunit ribosomal protein S1